MRERRRAERCELDVPVTVWGTSDETAEGRIRDLSACGIRFQLEVPVQKGALLGLIFVLPADSTGKRVYVWACGRAVRMEVPRAGREHEVCVAFETVKYDEMPISVASP